jgi:alpha-D-ribose 1-methylphosphonate 5-triphosphate synthase subunit PhnG
MSKRLDEYGRMAPPSPDHDNPAQSERAGRMSQLSQADPAKLEAVWAALMPQPSHRWLRPAETGLVMLRGRAGGTGQPFNLGEMTMTRASVLLAGNRHFTGFGYVAGRATRHTELAALFDALLQDDERRPALLVELMQPLEAAAAARAARAAAVAPTRVDFMTMVRGND